VVESLLLAVTRVSTMSQYKPLTNATGFFFQRDEKLFLVTCRHVVLDEANQHRPERLEIELHVDPENVAVTSQFSVPLYRDKKPLWRQGVDSAGMSWSARRCPRLCFFSRSGRSTWSPGSTTSRSARRC